MLRKIAMIDGGSIYEIALEDWRVPGWKLLGGRGPGFAPMKAARMLLTGERVSGRTALDWGLVDELARAEGLEEAAIAFAALIAENAPLAVEATRQTLRGGVRTATPREAVLQGRLKQTQDFAEGVRAVAEWRPGLFARS